ncbi:MAG: hypothetical protein QXW19_01845 [Candidatus Bathyarchaeia archaeon]
MRDIRLAPAILIALIALGYATTSFSVQGAVYQTPQFKVVRASWGTSDSEIQSAPGDKNIPLLVIAQNMSNSTITGLSGTLFLQPPFSNISGGRLARAFYEGSVPPGSTFLLRFPLNIDPDASPGEYRLSMRIEYLMLVSGVGKTLYVAMEGIVDIPVLVTGMRYLMIYSLSTLPSEIQPAGNFTISGSIVNTASSSFYNTNVSVSSPALVRSPFLFMGQVDPNIPRPFSFSLQAKRDLQSGEYPIKITVTYRDSLGVIHVNSATVTISVQQRAIQTRPVITQAERGPLETAIEIIWRLIRFFLGLFALPSIGRAWEGFQALASG